jgi:transcriptional regulator with XRE-family HTH domain
LLREYREFSQSVLAEKTKVSKQYISQLENGERKGTLAILKKIAKVLAVDLEDII